MRAFPDPQEDEKWEIFVPGESSCGNENFTDTVRAVVPSHDVFPSFQVPSASRFAFNDARTRQTVGTGLPNKLAA